MWAHAAVTRLVIKSVGVGSRRALDRSASPPRGQPSAEHCAFELAPGCAFALYCVAVDSVAKRPLRIGFIGFGEAGSTIARGLRSAGVEQLFAYDVAADSADR